MTIKDINLFIKTELEYLRKEIKGLDTNGIKYKIQKVLEKAVGDVQLHERNFDIVGETIKSLYIVNLTSYNFDVEAIMNDIKRTRFASVVSNTDAISKMMEMYKYGDKFYVQGLRGMRLLHSQNIENQLFDAFIADFEDGFKSYLRLNGRNKSYYGVEYNCKEQVYVSDSGTWFKFVLMSNKTVQLRIISKTPHIGSTELIRDLIKYLKSTAVKPVILGHDSGSYPFELNILEGFTRMHQNNGTHLDKLIDNLKSQSIAKAEELAALQAKENLIADEIFNINTDLNILKKAKEVADRLTLIKK